MIEFLTRMSTSEREALIKKLNGPQKRKSKAAKPSTSIPQESDCDPMTSQDKPQIKTPSKDVQDGQDKPLTEKQLAKIARDQKKKEKEDAKQAAEAAKKKMGNLMSGWISKALPSSSVSTTNEKQSKCIDLTSPKQVRIQVPSSSKKTSPLIISNGQQERTNNTLSDFDRVFKPFNLKANVSLAPVNRFAKAKCVDEDQSLASIEHIPDLNLQR